MHIPFEPKWRTRYYALLERVFDSGFLSEGWAVREFEEQWSAQTGGLESVAVANCGLGLVCALEFFDVRGKEVIVPTNTFMATVRAIEKAGGLPVFADCSRDDLCLTLAEVQRLAGANTGAVVLVHIGGHLAFESQAIADWLKAKNIPLVEDCAHAHGASFHGQAGGSFGDVGVYSFFATKTMTLGEGGMLCTKRADVAEWARSYRNYGKFEYRVPGMNMRMNEVTAALGLVQLERLPGVLQWKRELASKFDAIFPNRVRFPEGMQSGFYKYIVFDTPLTEATGTVYEVLCHEICGVKASFPNAKWVSGHHGCPPIYYGWDGFDLPPEAMRERLLKS